MKFRALLTLCILLLFSCSKKDDNFNQNDKNILNLEVGQKLRYVLYTGEEYANPSINNFVYPGDTLELEVLEVENNKYFISERITSSSNMMDSNVDYYWGSKDSIYANYWSVRNDSLVFELSSFKSHLIYRFGMFSEPKFSLREFDEEEVQILGWKTSFPYAEYDVELFTGDYTLFDNYYDRLNVFINNSFMANDGPGMTTVYSKEHGIIRTSAYSWWTGTGYGWDLLNKTR